MYEMWTKLTFDRIGNYLPNIHNVYWPRKYSSRLLKWNSGMRYIKYAIFIFRPKYIDSLYIDTTFCSPEALFIPSRQQSCEAVVRLAEEWLAESPTNQVVVNGKAALGYEPLFIRLAQHFNTKVNSQLKNSHVCRYTVYWFDWSFSIDTYHIESPTPFYTCTDSRKAIWSYTFSLQQKFTHSTNLITLMADEGWYDITLKW